MTKSYPLSNYDENFCLKPPLLLWAAVLYLSRGISLPLAAALCSLAGVSTATVTLLQSLWWMDALLPSGLAALVLLALFRRVPTASDPVRWIWSHGRWILAVSAVLDLLIAVLNAHRQGGMVGSLPSLLAATGDLYFAAYLFLARRASDVFTEFPARAAGAGK